MSTGFEWDPTKREANLVKHGIDFVDAVRIFEAGVTEWEDKRREWGEPRFVAVGEAANHILTVIYTPRGDTKRIISARRARREEKATYRALRPAPPPQPDRLGPG